MGEKKRKRVKDDAEDADTVEQVESDTLNDKDTDQVDPQGADVRPATAEPTLAKKGKSAPVLPWMRVPITIDPLDGILLEDVGGLDPRLSTALNGMNIEVLFPVQSVVWKETSGGASARHDICIAAPTGSGKTLAYSLPILQGLSTRTVPKLRALILLPTRDLAMQVHGVLAMLCPALGLSVQAACGNVSLEEEAAALSSSTYISSSNALSTTRNNNSGCGVDIMVATPGRLMAHLTSTPGFTLQHLQYLVVDETDRLLRQSYQGWLPRVMAALPSTHSSPLFYSSKSHEPEHDGGFGSSSLESSSKSHMRQASNNTKTSTSRVIKMVVSATLTRDPSKLDPLHLHCPRYIAMSAEDHRYKLPKGLQESKLVVPAEKKPFALVAVLKETLDQPTIVFTSSLEATHRLYLLLSVLPSLGPVSAEYSSSVSPEARKSALSSFRSGQTTILVSSDAMTRGMDLENVARVINYDAPVYVKTYVHRAGRAARANKQGSVLTLLRKEDVRHFKDILRKVDNTYVKDYEPASAVGASGGSGAVHKPWEEEGLKMQVHLGLAVMAEKLEEEKEKAKTVFSKGTGAGASHQSDKPKSIKKRKLQKVPELI